MLKMERLRKEALESCECLGHDMLKFDRYMFVWFSKCRVCGMEVCVTKQPAPHEVEISGKAVALYCTGKKNDVVE